MRILSVATSDQGGGAERIAWDLFTGLAERGHASYLAVGAKHGTHPAVFELHASPWFDYNQDGLARSRFAAGLERRWRRLRGAEDFSHPYSWHLPAMLPEPPDVILAHNLHGGYFDLRALPRLSRIAPVLLVLHDYWLLTGHCAYPFDCDRWRRGCGNCPYLETPPAITRDATHTNLELKRSIYLESRLTICSPGRRLLEQVPQSVLGAGSPSTHRIANGVDLQLFRPGDQREARLRLDLPLDVRIVLLLGSDVRHNPFKDHACAMQALRLVAAQGQKILLLALGAREESLSTDDDLLIRALPFEADRSRIADYFRAADVLLHATKQEVAPLVLSEALAAGLPSVASDVGDTRELLGDAGIVVPVGDARAHADAIAKLLTDEDLRHRMGRGARQRAEADGGRIRMVAEYERILMSLAENSNPAGGVRRESAPSRAHHAPSAGQPPRFTVIYPCTDVRGDVTEHLRAWTSGQTLHSSRYRVIAVCMADDGDARLREVLGPEDQVVYAPQRTDIAMWNAGAAAATTEWLVFTEGHSPGRPDCLQALEQWLADDPEADAGNFAIGHPRNYLMARLSDRWFSEQQAIWHGEWPRLHRAGHAIRREAFEAVDGFPPYGQFGIPMFSADLHRHGFRVAMVPGAEVVHIDDANVHDHHFDTIDFVHGECRARSERDPISFERYFGQRPEWWTCISEDPEAVRNTLRAIRHAGTDDAAKADQLREEEQRLRRIARRPRSGRITRERWTTRLDEALMLALPLPGEWRYRWFVRAHARVVEQQRLQWIHQHATAPPRTTGAGRWTIEQLGPEDIGGVHALERSEQGMLFRWSEPYLRLRFAKEQEIRRVRLITHGLRGDPEPAVLLAACGPRPLPGECIHRDEDNALRIDLPEQCRAQAATHGLSLVFDPLLPGTHGSTDQRRLGIPIFAVEFE